MALLKPFRALRYDAAAGPLDALVSPPHDVIDAEQRARLLARSPYNAVRLLDPERPEDAAAALRDWRARGLLRREEEPAAWLLEDEFTGPDGVRRRRRAVVARVALEPYDRGRVLPHERTFAASAEARLRLLRATRTKLSPILLLHGGGPPELPERPPDVEATLDGVASRLWRAGEDELERIEGRLIIADGHHRYEASRRFHEEEGREETGHVLAALVSRRDEGLTIFPTHRLAGGRLPELNGGLRRTPVGGDPLERLAGAARPAFVVLSGGAAVLAEGEGEGPVGALDTALVDRLGLEGVSFTASVAEAAAAVREGVARAAFLVRAPTIEQVEAVALAGEAMPQKSTYFFPKLTGGLLFSPFDE